jgi:hypothetical protein
MCKEDFNKKDHYFRLYLLFFIKNIAALGRKKVIFKLKSHIFYTCKNACMGTAQCPVSWGEGAGET